MTFETFLNIALVIFLLADAIMTHKLFKRLKDYGFPNWAECERSYIYRPFMKRFGLTRGIILGWGVVSIVMLFFFFCYTKFLNFFGYDIRLLYVGFGVIYGIAIVAVFLNFDCYCLPPEKYNENLLGKRTSNNL